MGVVALLTVVLVLSFAGPENSEKPFWRAVQRLRRGFDAVSYWIINGFAILTILLVLIAAVRAIIHR